MLTCSNISLYGLDVTRKWTGDWEAVFVREMAVLRKELGLNQTDLARQLKENYGLPFHQQTIQRIEAGERPIRLNEAHYIAQELNSSLDAMSSSRQLTATEHLRRQRDAMSHSLTAAEHAVREYQAAVRRMTRYVPEGDKIVEALSGGAEKMGALMSEVHARAGELKLLQDDLYRQLVDQVGDDPDTDLRRPLGRQKKS